jgi:hypothetical protein
LALAAGDAPISGSKVAVPASVCGFQVSGLKSRGKERLSGRRTAPSLASAAAKAGARRAHNNRGRITLFMNIPDSTVSLLPL